MDFKLLDMKNKEVQFNAQHITPVQFGQNFKREIQSCLEIEKSKAT